MKPPLNFAVGVREAEMMYASPTSRFRAIGEVLRWERIWERRAEEEAEEARMAVRAAEAVREDISMVAGDWESRMKKVRCVYAGGICTSIFCLINSTCQGAARSGEGKRRPRSDLLRLAVYKGTSEYLKKSTCSR